MEGYIKRKAKMGEIKIEAVEAERNPCRFERLLNM